MKILLIMDPGILVPPKEYGGHERLVFLFASEYMDMGHEVHLLVTPGSFVPGCIMHYFGKEGFPPNKLNSLLAIISAWKFLWFHRRSFDLIHNFGRLAYLLPVWNYPIRKIMTYGREISNRNIRIANKLPQQNVIFTACSRNLLSRVKTGGNWRVVYNSINFSRYIVRESVAFDAPLIFLGRLERVKGVHTAIKLAKKVNSRLVIAGNISSLEEEKKYFESQIKPEIDGSSIIYVGALDDENKNKWLGQARALLFPIEWNEPFGMVMIESMACGTPVIGLNMGSVPEVIDNGKTGFVVNNFDEMVTAVGLINTIDRKSCASLARERFNSHTIALEYLKLIDDGRANNNSDTN